MQPFRPCFDLFNTSLTLLNEYSFVHYLIPVHFQNIGNTCRAKVSDFHSCPNSWRGVFVNREVFLIRDVTIALGFWIFINTDTGIARHIPALITQAEHTGHGAVFVISLDAAFLTTRIHLSTYMFRFYRFGFSFPKHSQNVLFVGVIIFLSAWRQVSKVSTSQEFLPELFKHEPVLPAFNDLFVNTLAKMFASDGSFSRIQHYVTSTHAIRFVIAGVTGGIGTYTFSQTGNAIASGSWVNSGSDERVKNDIAPIQNPRDVLMGIRAATWRYRHKGAEVRFGMGVIANDIARFFPDAVINTGSRELDDGTVIDDVLAVEAGDSGSMVAVHHAVLQSLVEENTSQQLEIEALKSSMQEPKKMVEERVFPLLKGSES